MTFPRSGRRADSLSTQMREQEVSKGNFRISSLVFFREQGSQEVGRSEGGWGVCAQKCWEESDGAFRGLPGWLWGPSLQLSSLCKDACLRAPDAW